MSASLSARRGGQPSTTQPIAGPWLSPQVVTRNRWPKVLCDMRGEGPRPPVYSPAAGLDDRDIRRGGVLHPDDVVAAIDVMHLSGHRRGKIGQQIHPSPTHLFDRNISLHRRIELVPAQDVAEV